MQILQVNFICVYVCFQRISIHLCELGWFYLPSPLCVFKQPRPVYNLYRSNYQDNYTVWIIRSMYTCSYRCIECICLWNGLNERLLPMLHVGYFVVIVCTHVYRWRVVTSVHLTGIFLARGDWNNAHLSLSRLKTWQLLVNHLLRIYVYTLRMYTCIYKVFTD